MTRKLPSRKERLAAEYKDIGKDSKPKPDWMLTEEEIDEGIMKVSMWGLESRLLPYLKLKQLKLADGFVLMGMARFGGPKTYRLRLTLTALAEEMGVTLASISQSVSRLKAAGIVAMRSDASGSTYYVIDPAIISFNNNKSHIAAAYREIEEAMSQRIADVR